MLAMLAHVDIRIHMWVAEPGNMALGWLNQMNVEMLSLAHTHTRILEELESRTKVPIPEPWFVGSWHVAIAHTP